MGQSFWVFVYLWPIINTCFIFSLLTGPRTLPNRHVQLFAKMDPTTEVCGCMPTLIMGWHLLPFWPQEAFCACADRDFFLDLRSEHHISLLQQSSASASSFVLGVSGWEQNFSFTPLDNQSPVVQSRGLSVSYLTFNPFMDLLFFASPTVSRTMYPWWKVLSGGHALEWPYTC